MRPKTGLHQQNAEINFSLSASLRQDRRRSREDMLEVKRRLIESCAQSGDSEYARRVIEDIGRFLRCLREDLEEQL